LPRSKKINKGFRSSKDKLKTKLRRIQIYRPKKKLNLRLKKMPKLKPKKMLNSKLSRR
jgi:hypothetical protein